MGDRPVRFSFTAIHYNSWPATKDSIESLFAELWADAEVVVVDGGSTDPSRAWLESFARDHPDRFTLIPDPGGNRGRGRDLAWRAGRGDVIIHIDADRTWRKGSLGELRAIVEKHGGRHVVVTSYLDGVPIGGCNILPRELLEKIDGYDRSLTYYEDVDMNHRSERLAPIVQVRADSYEANWRGKMRRPGYLAGYYWGMCRDGARMGWSMWSQIRRGLRRVTSWPFVAVGVVAWLSGRFLMPPARSVAERRQR